MSRFWESKERPKDVVHHFEQLGAGSEEFQQGQRWRCKYCGLPTPSVFHNHGPCPKRTRSIDNDKAETNTDS